VKYQHPRAQRGARQSLWGGMWIRDPILHWSREAKSAIETARANTAARIARERDAKTAWAARRAAARTIAVRTIAAQTAVAQTAARTTRISTLGLAAT
jgi:hypothetical protein